MAHYMEITSLAKGFHLHLASSPESYTYLGQSPEKGIHWALKYALSCMQQEEYMEHILNQCPFSAEIWDQVAQIMRKMDRARESIIHTIENWGLTTFHNPILNRIWQLLPRFCCLENMEGVK
jgi:hypothetical protein